MESRTVADDHMHRVLIACGDRWKTAEAGKPPQKRPFDSASIRQVFGKYSASIRQVFGNRLFFQLG
jgi:hypothetical protein